MKKLAKNILLVLGVGVCFSLIFFVVINFYPQNNFIKKVEAANTISCSVEPFAIKPGENITITADVNFDASDVWAMIEGNDGVASSHYSLVESPANHWTRTYSSAITSKGLYDMAIYATVNGTGEQILCNPSAGSTWIKKTRSSMPWHSRNGHEVLSYQGYLWLLGGLANNYENDVWRSQDGENWDLVTADASWPARTAFGSAVFADKMWIFGGWAYTAPNTRVFYNDVWWSTNGKDWTKVSDDLGYTKFSNNGLFATAIYDNKIWISGGYTSTAGLLNELWYTSNPASGWSQVTLSSGFGNMALHQMVPYNDGSNEKLWIIEGYRKYCSAGANAGLSCVTDSDCPSSVCYTGTRNHVWQATSSSSTSWSRLKFCQGGTNIGKICTDDSGCPSSTCDYAAPYTARNDFISIIYDYPEDLPNLGNKILIMSGASLTNAMLNDVWSYQPSQGWIQVIDPDDAYLAGSEPTTWTNWSARFRSKAVVHDTIDGEKIFILGGYEYKYRYWNDVWTTSDGANWDLLGEHYDGIFGKRWGSSMAAFDGDGAGTDPEKLWFFGAGTDIWSSPDGVIWTKEGDSTDWSSRWGHKTLLYNNKLWLIGGCKTGSGGGGIQCGGICNGGADDGKACTKGLNCGDSSTCVYAGLNDVWSTADGMNWDLTTPSSTDYFFGRYLFAPTIFNDGSGEKMWILGGDVSGKCTGGTYINEICRADADCPSSTCSKVCVAGSNIGSACSSHSNCGTNGNCNYYALNDVLSSADGATWTLETNNGTWSTRRGHSAIGYDGNLYVMGGFPTTTGVITGSYNNEVWKSADGASWTQATSSAAWNPRYSFALLNFQDKMWVYGGNNGLYGNIPGSRMDSNNVWWSTDGANWNQATGWAEWDGRDFFSYTVFQDRMWLMGGDSMSSGTTDVWASRYGDMVYYVMPEKTGQVIITAQVQPEISLVLSENSCDLGLLSASVIQTCGYSAAVATNAQSGYAGYIRQNHGFEATMNEVTNEIHGENGSPLQIEGSGSLSGENGEYGVGIQTADITDWPEFTGSCSDYDESGTYGGTTSLPAKAVDWSTVANPDAYLGDNMDNVFASNSEAVDGVNDGLTYFCHGVRIKWDTPPGSYSHTVTISVIANF